MRALASCRSAFTRALHSRVAQAGQAHRAAGNHQQTARLAVRARVSTKELSSSLSGSSDSIESQKAKALDATIKEINSRFGKGSIMKLGSGLDYKVETIPSGALTLDIALGGGFPKGRIIEVFGPESSGKTTLALHAMAAVQRQGGKALLMDAEHAFDPIYSKKMGLNVDDLYLCQPDSGEMALEIVDSAVRSNSFDIIAVDSVAALVPRAEIEGEIGNVQVGAQARLMSHALRKITANASKCATTIIFLNQLRYKVGVLYGNPEITSGGNALKFYSSVRMEVRRKATIEGAKGDSVGIRVRAKVVKNKCAPPYKMAEFDIMFGSGISTLGCMLDAAEAVGIVQRKGSWYYAGEQKLAQGRDKTLAVLEENAELAQDLEARTRTKLSGEVDINEITEKEARLAAGGADDDFDDLGLEDDLAAPPAVAA